MNGPDKSRIADWPGCIPREILDWSAAHKWDVTSQNVAYNNEITLYIPVEIEK